VRRLSLNDPPTALVGFRKTRSHRHLVCRLSLNDPPTALVGVRKTRSHRHLVCRLSLNDPPIGLAGLARRQRIFILTTLFGIIAMNHSVLSLSIRKSRISKSRNGTGYVVKVFVSGSNRIIES
jgi:hypothetical protein